MPLEEQQIGRYRLLRILGSGGMGEVYLATDTLINRQVAIKVIKVEGLSFTNTNVTMEANRLFQREMRAITSLDHPHILPVFDYGEIRLNGATITYMVMPYRPEGSLSSWLQRRGRAKPLGPQEVADIVHQAAGALQHAHSRQIIHQDVKPGNFLIHLDEENPNRPNLLLADFGVAKFSSSTASIDVSTSSIFAIRGTPSYMAPEQWEGHPVPATDQYALAVMAYELLAGRAPFQGNPSQMMYQHFRNPPALPSTYNPGIPATIDAVLLRALAKRPEERFPSVSAFTRAFEGAAQSISTLNKTDIQASGGDLRAMLAISKLEAVTGTSRTLTLPGGRQVNVSVPAGAQNGQVMYLQELGRQGSMLILTLLIQQAEETNELPGTDDVEKTVGVSKPEPQSPTIPASNSDLRPPVFPALPSPYLQTPPTPGVLSDPNHQPPVPQAPPPPYWQVPTTPVLSHQDFQNPVKPASHPSGQQPITPAYSPIQEIPAVASINREADGSRSSFSKRNTILLAALTLLIIAGCTGLFYALHTDQVAVDNASATAQAHATNTAAANATANSLANATATASVIAANPDPYGHGQGTLALYDLLSGNNRHKYGWNVGSTCIFKGGAYHANILNQHFTDTCVAKATDFFNFVFEVRMTITKGDCGGVAFRNDPVTDKHYFFEVCQNGYYAFLLYAGGSGVISKIFANRTSMAIRTGTNQANVIAVVANVGTFDLYANKQKIVSISDRTFSHGQIGVVASASNNPTEVVYSNAKVWTL